MAIWKLLQKKLLTFLTTKWGLTLCIVGILLCLNTSVSIIKISLLHDDENDLIERDWEDNIAGRSLAHIMMPPEIDAVYTWVNGSDPRLIAALRDARNRSNLLCKPKVENNNITQLNSTGSTNATEGSTAETAAEDSEEINCFSDADSSSRFIDNEELRYSIRSLEKYAPWIRNIYVVTNGQIPYWLDLSNPKIHLITHEMIFDNSSHLPTFSSPAIESHLHKIPGLSERFMYLNDDVMLGAEVYPDDFFTLGGGYNIFLAWPVPDCAPGCASSWISDGYCDQACNVSECNWDGIDCINATNTRFGIGGTGTATNTNGYCSVGCPDSWIGDKYCDNSCKKKECAWDGGDCGSETMFNSMWGVNVTSLENLASISVPDDENSLYINFQPLIQNREVIESIYTENDVIRTATFSQKHKILALTLFPDKLHGQLVQFKAKFANSEEEEEEEEEEDISTIDDDGEDGQEFNDEDDTTYLFNMTFGRVSNAPTTESNSGSASSDEVESADSDNPAENAGDTTAENRPESDEDAPMLHLRDLALGNRFWGAGRTRRNLRPTGAPGEESGMDRVRNHHTRKLLDTFGDSLRFVNRLMTEKFGSEPRKVISHMPHMIDKSVMDEVIHVWPKEFEATSSHIFRHPDDMQYAFTHFYYLMHQRKPFDILQVWENELDTDHSGGLSGNELRTLAVKLYGTPINNEKFKELREKLASGECSLHENSAKTSSSTDDSHSGSTASSQEESMGVEAMLTIMEAALQSSSQANQEVPDQNIEGSDQDSAEQNAEGSDPDEMYQNTERSDQDENIQDGNDQAGSDQPDSDQSGSDQDESIQENNDQDEDVQNANGSDRDVTDQNADGNDVIFEESRSQENVTDTSNSTKEGHEENEDYGGIHIRLDQLLNCESVLEDMHAYYSRLLKNRHKNTNDDDIYFIMLPTNASRVQWKLDEIRQKPRKFICLNDDIDHNDPNSERVLKVVRNFYDAMYGTPSSFELPRNQRNRALHWDDYQKLAVKTNKNQLLYVIGFVSAAILVLLLFCECCGSRFSKDRTRRERRMNLLLQT
eukprot:TRINITY_DN1305_c0_g1_i1.p1 TRINITY_DN1305_c0_g1~~TRINITY_DN1305_c0_g1_i1.p1  ORF type:complete len:1052 (-),score=178.20 TRINITY_DN1305_c0_g1_i1:110-3265(-)